MHLLLRDVNLAWPQGEGFAVSRGDVHVLDGVVLNTVPATPPRRTLECGGRLALPGLVNAHHHIYSALAAGLDPGLPLLDFTGILRGMWWRLDRALDRDAVRLSAMLAARESLRWGVTTVFDHHISVPFIEGSLALLQETLQAQGVAGVLCFETSGRNGGEVFRRSLDENVRHGAMLGLHAGFTLSDDELAACAAACPRPVHVHIAEGMADEDDARRRGLRAAARLDRFGLLRPGSILAHGCHLDDDELALLAGRGVWLAQAAESNLNNAQPPLDLRRALDAGLHICVGTDGMSGAVLRAWRTSVLYNRFIRRSPDVGWDVAVALLLGNWQLKRAWGLPRGVLPGEVADIAVMDYTSAGPLDAGNLPGHLLYGAAEAPARWVVRADGLSLDDFLPTAPPPENTEAITRALWKRFANEEPQ